MHLHASKDCVSSPLRKRGATPKRLQPSEPLHMTTRSASRATSVVSATGKTSAVGDPSRNTQETGSENESDRPAKILRRSGERSIACSGRSFSSSPESAGATKGESVGRPDDWHPHTPPAIEREIEPGCDGGSRIEDEVDIPKASIEIPAWEQKSHENDKVRGRRLVASPAPQVIFASHRTSSRGTPSHSQKHDSIERGSPWKHNSSGILEKLPGRRRAPHPDAHIEASLRRQLELKVAYRAVVKALKPILGELAARTAKDLHVDPNLHRQYPEFEEIQTELDFRLSQRLAELTTQLREEEARMKRMFSAVRDITESGFAQKVQDLRGDWLLRCQDHFLSTVREKQKQEDSDATDDEDRTVLGPHITRSSGTEGYAAFACRDSRSQFFVKTQRFWEDFELRQDVCKELREHDHTVVIAKPKDFAVYDGDQRRNSIAVLNLNLLVNASRDIEDQAARTLMREKSIIRNCEASGLQVLATAVEMASPPTPISYPSFQRPQESAHVLSVQRQPISVTGTIPSKSFIFATQSPMKGTAARKRQTPARAAGKGQIGVGRFDIPPVEHGTAVANGQGSRPLPALIAKPPTLTDRGNVPLSPAFKSDNSPFSLVVEAATVTPLPIFNTSRVPSMSKPSGKVSDGHPAHIAMPVDQRLTPDEVSAGLLVTKSSTETKLPPRLPTAIPKLSRQRKRPGPRAHYASHFSVCPTGLTPEQMWSPFTNTMGPPMFLPKYIKDSDVKRKDMVSNSPISPVIAPVTGLLADHAYQLDRRNSGVAQQMTPRSTHQLIAPASTPATENVVIAPVQHHGHLEPHAYQPTHPTSRGFVNQSRLEAYRPPLFLQPMQPSPFLNAPHPYQNPFYQPSNIYGPFQGYNNSQNQNQASPSTYHPLQSRPPPLLPSPSIVAQQQQQRYYAAGPAFQLSVPPSTAPPPQGSPSQPYSRGIQSRHNSMPVSMMLQQTGQSGHQPILPATMDPRRRQDELRFNVSGTTMTGTRGVPRPERALEFDYRQYAQTLSVTQLSTTPGDQRQRQQQGSGPRRHSSPQNFRP